MKQPGSPRVRWQALGTYVDLCVEDAGKTEAAERRARELLDLVDRTCSRFRVDSELNRVNAGAGTWVRTDPLLVAATVAALEAADHTDGIVHPLLGRVMIALGYDRTFAALQPGRTGAPRVAPPAPESWRLVEWKDDALKIPVGTALDLGACAKAWASDLISRSIAEELRTGVALSLGGDVAIAGGERTARWPVEIREHPAGPVDARVELTAGGLATSSTVVRRWTIAGVVRHHLVDPRTGDPARTHWRTVTATGPSATAANVATTAAVILAEDAVDWLTQRGVAARLVSEDGAVTVTPGWPDEGEQP